MTVDTIVVAAYFLFLIAIGWMFRTFTTSTSDYFRGGGKMLWWMVGATAFMTQFSAWTFTGAAGRAYSDGFVVVILFLANAFGYFVNYMYFAPKFRQLRVVTAIEAIRQRFGKTSEQFFTWGGMPDSLISAGIWLNGLAIFVAAVFDIPMEATIIVTGLVLMLMSVTGGSWAVVASDFMQMLVIMAVTITCAVAAYFQGGGITNIVNNFQGDFFVGNNLNYMSIFVLWVVFIFIKQFGVMNNSINAYRYLCAKDSENARKAAGLACVLMIIGPVIWFLPAWYVGAFMPNFATEYGAVGNDAAYLAFVQHMMPAGMVGLLMSAMFAATMSSMDSGLNRNAGIFVMNFYSPILRPNASQKELVVVSKTTTIVMGFIIIAIGLFINSLRHLSLFDIVLNVGALIGFPMLIPVLLGMWIRKTPDWSAWTTLIVGGIVSWVFGISLQAHDVEHFFGLEQALTGREWSDLKVALSLAAHVVFTGGFFLLTMLFYRGRTPEREAEVERLFENWNTPVVSSGEAQHDLDTKQRSMLGRLICTAGFGVLAMALLPNEMTGRMLFLLCGSIVLVVGVLLVNASKVQHQTVSES
ncbi:sodium:solute symporter family protein [Vibrio algivorus]|uniref:Na+:solute symporter n=1 Tax=Vibrio algivorus TaxID=1667024 RepID=A0A1B4Z1L5_9VIBR|nr:sodium:solute symporter family protein [Vibrio algivorus]TVO36734.1 Na+:solute symporter [Vibrio algivorus]BAV53311.1 oligoalginate transporter [Vibrio algivorus]GLT15408.1 transporter [Vibrio algivorus]